MLGQVLVPPAVERELQQPPGVQPLVTVTQISFIQVQAPQDQARVQQLLQQLDPGESEALALALEVRAATLLIDETRGRAVAQQLGVPISGTLGVLLQAKSLGLVPAVQPLLDSLEADLGFFLSPQLRADVLRLAGE